MGAGNVIKKLSRSITVTPVLAGSGAYSAGQCVGTVMELVDAVESLSGTSEIVSANISDKDKQNAAISLLIFKSKPAGTFTDQATANPSQADLNLICGVIPIAAANYVSLSANSVAGLNNIRAKVKAAAATNQLAAGNKSKSLWLLLVTSGTPTYTAASSLQITLNLEQDA